MVCKILLLTSALVVIMVSISQANSVNSHARCSCSGCRPQYFTCDYNHFGGCDCANCRCIWAPSPRKFLSYSTFYNFLLVVISKLIFAQFANSKRAWNCKNISQISLFFFFHHCFGPCFCKQRLHLTAHFLGFDSIVSLQRWFSNRSDAACLYQLKLMGRPGSDLFS